MMGSQKNFTILFGMILKDTFMKSLKESKQLKHLCVLQWQATIKLLEKPNKDKKYIYKGRPISLLNFDLKIISKSWATRVNKIISNLIDAKQTAYVNENLLVKVAAL